MTAPISFSGVESGLNTSAIINAELMSFEAPLQSLQAQQSSLNTQISDYQTIKSDLLSLQQAGDALASPLAFDQAFSVSSSNSSVASGTISSGSNAGSVTLAVDQLATGSTQISAGTVSATNDVVASGDYLVGAGGAALGISSFGGQSGLAIGSHSIGVTQASSGATVSATSSVSASTTISSSNNTITANIDGTSTTLTIASGTYTQSQLAQAVSQASGGALSASVSSSGILSIATTQQGSSSSLQITGGTALSSLGLVAGSVMYGTDGIINVDGNANTISNISGTGTTQVTLTSGSGGTITANLSGPLSVGTMSAQNVSVGDGSLSSVVSAINSAGAGVTANALQVGTNAYALEITSNKTGTSGAATIDTQAFTASSLGAMQTTTAAQNSIVSVGGVGGYEVTSSTNAVTGILPGVTINLSQVSSSPVTLTVSPDGSQVAGQVSTLVKAANQLLSDISTYTAYNPSTNQAGPLNGQVSLTNLAQQVIAMVGNVIGNSAAGSDGTAGESAGLAVNSKGTITFNKNAFVTAYDANPTAVQSMFTEGGSFAPSSSAYSGQVTVVGGSNSTLPGTYAVSISQSAAQATDVGSASFASSTSTLATAESYTITSGSLSATYAATAGESISSVIAGINAATAAAGISVSASLAGSSGAYNVQLNSADYGSAASFGVSASGSDQLGLTTSGASFTGKDVAGTINGLAASGSGQTLTLNSPGNAADGLAIQVATPGITSSTSLGSVTYSPGIAQSLAAFSVQSTQAPGGVIASSITGLQNTLSSVNSNIAQQQQLVTTEKKMLTQEFTAMEEALAQLNSVSKFLAQSASTSSSPTSSLSGGTTSSTTSGG